VSAGLAVALALVAGASAPASRQDREVMHTTVSVVIADGLPPEKLAAAFDDAFQVFTTIDETMNEWRPQSALGKINANAGKEPVPTPAPLCAVLRASLEGARKTHGLFDPTWAALRGLWRFGDGDAPAVPPAEALKEKCALVGFAQVELKAAAGGDCTVRLPREGMKLGLSGVVKGFGVDEAAKRLRARGVKNFFIQAGGDLYFAGKAGDRPWRAGIREPRGAPDESFATLDVSDRAFSTSGDYEHFFVKDGVRYHHLIDLRTCWPAKASRSVTVLAKTATDAEFLTKAAFVLGGAEGLKLVESFGGAAVIVDAENHVHVSKALEGKLTLRPPAAEPAPSSP
jgi:thiamine biosynthesis lipoprotein